MSTQIFRLINEAEAELCHGVRAFYWQPVIDAARRENESNEKLGQAFDHQSRELEIACELMTPEQLTEYRHRAYPKLYPEPDLVHLEEPWIENFTPEVAERHCR
jgi:hypothetical protein